MKSLAPIVNDYDLVHKLYVDGKFLSGLTTNGNNLQYTLNGANKLITVPYATNADKLDGISSEKFVYNNSLVYGRYNRLFSFKLGSGEKGEIVFRVTGRNNTNYFSAEYAVTFSYSESLTDEKKIDIICRDSTSLDLRTKAIAVRRTTSLDGTETITGAFDIYIDTTSPALYGNCSIISYAGGGGITFLTRTPIKVDELPTADFTSVAGDMYSGVFYGSLSGNASSATYATNARITNTEPTGGTSYYPTFVSGITANANYPLRGNDTISYRLFEGTADASGFAGLLLGNNIASGTAGNAYGFLRLYGTNTGYTTLRAKSQTDNYTALYLPSANGTLVYHTTGTAIGSANAPVYVDSTGKVTACSDLLKVRIGAFANNTEAASSSEIPTKKFEGALYGSGMYMTTNYGDSNTPATYGNIINLMGSGGGQILASWNGAYKTGSLYYRSHRDNTESGGWTPWVTILDSQNFTATLDSSYVKKSGDTMTGPLAFNGTTYPHIYGNGSILVLSGKGGYNQLVIDSGNTTVRPSGTNLQSLGNSSNRWSNIYSVKGNFASSEAGIVKLKNTTTNGGAYIDYYHANQDTNYWRVGSNTVGWFSFGYNGKEVGLWVNTQGQLYSNKATGTAPFVVASTTEVSNLNTEYVKGYTVNRAGFVTNTDGTTTMIPTLDKQCNVWFNASVSSYWTKFATIAAPGGNGTVIVTLLVGNEHQSGRYQGRGILEFKIRNDSSTPSIYFSAVSGDIDCSCFRCYYPTTISSGSEIELWVNVKRSWNSAVIKVLNETNAYKPINNVKMFEGGRSVVETPTLENYVEPTRISLATKLATPVTLWGQSFDGSGNVSGDLTGVGNITPSATTTYSLGTSATRWKGIYGQQLNLNGSATIGSVLNITGTSDYSEGIRIHSYNGFSSIWFNAVNDSGVNAGICGITVNSTGFRFRLPSSVTESTPNDYLNINYGGNVGIGVTSPTHKLHVNGGLKVTDNILTTLNKFICTSEYDTWAHKYTDADGNEQTIELPHYGYVINTNPANYIGGGFLSNYFGLNFHVGAAATKIRFGCGDAGSETWTTTLTGGGALTLAQSLTVNGISTLKGVVYTGTTLYTHGKTGTTDGKAGFYAASGYIGITGATPCINFYYGNSTSATSTIKEASAGVLVFSGTGTNPHKLQLNLGDATAKFYAVDIDSSDYGNEAVALQTCFDNTDPEVSDFTTSHEARCNLLLQPRGGQVYVGYTPADYQTTYALSVGSNMRLYGSQSDSPELLFYRDGVSSWKIINTAGKLIFRNNYTTAVQSSYFDVFTLNYNSGNATLKGQLTTGSHILPSTHGGASIGQTAQRWAVGYFTSLVNIGSANSTSTSGDSNTTIGAGSIELSHSTPVIDFHYNNSTADYTNRIIEGLSGQLTVTGKLRVGLSYATSTDYNFHVVGTAYASTSLTTPTGNITTVNATTVNATTVNATTLRRIQSAASTVPTIWVTSGNYDNTVLRVDYSKNTNYYGDYGFTLKYMGTGNGYQNNLNLYADNTTVATQNIAWSVNQLGQVAIRTDATNTSYDLYVNSTAYIPTLTVTEMKIGDATITWDSTNNALKIDKSVYSTGGVSALGYSETTSDGNGGGIVSTVLSEYNLINTTLTEDVTVVASAYATKRIYNSVKTNTTNISTLQTNYSAMSTTVNNHTSYIDALNNSQFYSSGDASTGLTLTWFTQSGAGRSVTIPTWNSLGQTWSTYDNTPCLISSWLFDDIGDMINTYAVTGIGTSGSYLTYTKNGTTTNVTVPYASYSGYSNSVKSTVPTSTTTAYATGYLKSYYAGGSNTVTNKPTGVDAFGMISMQTASGYTGQILISANTNVDMYWKTGASGSLSSVSWKKLLDDSNTSFTQKTTSGTEIGTITIGGTSTKIYAPFTTAAAVSVVNNLTSTSTTSALSAYQGKVLNDKFADYLTTSVASNTYMPKAGGDFSGDVCLYDSDVYGSENDYEYWRITYLGAATFATVNGYTLGTACAKSFTTSVTSGSTSLVTSGAVYTALANQKVTVSQTLTSGTAIGTIKIGGTSTTIYAPTPSSSSVTGDYLPLSGGTLTGGLTINNNSITIKDTNEGYTHSISYDSDGGFLALNGSKGTIVNGQLLIAEGYDIVPKVSLSANIGMRALPFNYGYFNTLIGLDSSNTQMWKIDGSNGWIYTGAKTSHNDGVTGCVITQKGMFICSDSSATPRISFLCNNATGYTSWIAGTSSNGVEVRRNFDVYTDSASFACYLALTYGGTSGKRWRIRNTTNTTATSIGLQIEYGSNTDTAFTSALYFTNSGDATFAKTVSCTTLTQTSDVRYKNILGDVTLTTSQIANAPAVYFTWNSGDDTTTRQIGTTAQYWRQYVPEATVDIEGRYGLNYSALALVSTVVIARSVETHEQRITRLEERIKALEEENKELINKLNNM